MSTQPRRKGLVFGLPPTPDEGSLPGLSEKDLESRFLREGDVLLREVMLRAAINTRFALRLAEALAPLMREDSRFRERVRDLALAPKRGARAVTYWEHAKVLSEYEVLRTRKGADGKPAGRERALDAMAKTWLLSHATLLDRLKAARKVVRPDDRPRFAKVAIEPKAPLRK